MVEEADEPVEVLYGADIDTTITGSGFPQKVCMLHACHAEFHALAALHAERLYCL